MATLPRFSDFAASETRLAGDKKKVMDVLNRLVAITGWRTMDSKCEQGKTCLELQFEYANEDGTTDGVKYVFFTASEVLLKQIRQYEDKIPFLTVIVKQGNYYTFT